MAGSKKYFRNANHAIWFLCAVAVLAVALAGYFFPRNLFVFLLIPAVIHLPPLATAIRHVRSGSPSELYTNDCIWFNAGMILIYTGLFVFRGLKLL